MRPNFFFNRFPMSKLNQIENALKSIDAATFQMLCDAYLHRKDYVCINRIGSVAGKRKTKTGTPDTYVVLPNGRYVFAEYTSQEKGLCEKLSGDIEKCLDETKTGVPVNLIQNIILCHTGKLDPAEMNRLRTRCITAGCDLETFGLDTLALDLWLKYPTLAKEFLGVELDTGQILLHKDFVEEYGKSQMTTPLSTRFQFREEELKTAQTSLENSNLLILSGKAGVGKSRFALEIGERFVNGHSDFEFYCVLNKDQFLYENLKAYFLLDKNYVILVDDANRISASEVGHIFRLLNDVNAQHKIKIIVTVRDYALEKVREWAKPYAGMSEIFLDNFNREQLGELVKAEYNIHNQNYIERIWMISQGNSRLAMMAAKVAIKNNNLESLSNVADLYDEYFGTISQDLNELKNPGLLKAAGVLSLFRVIDRTREDGLIEVAEKFNVSATELWDNILKLHEMELVDLHAAEVAKISDQVLATYLIYKSFFKDQVLDFSVVLEHFFDTQRFALNEYQIKDVLYPVFSAFDHQFVASRLQSHINHKWEIVKHDEVKLLHLINTFWFLRKIPTLLFIKEKIEFLEEPPLEVSKIDFSINSNSTQDAYLRVLELFGNGDDADCNVAIDLLLLYLQKRPELTSQVLRILTNSFSFSRDSHLRGYNSQKSLLLKLVQKSEDAFCGEFFTHILLAVAPHYTAMQFRNDWTEKRGMQLVWTEFSLLPSDEISDLRATLWQFLEKSWRKPSLKSKVNKIITTYGRYWHDAVVPEIAQSDSKILLPFLASSLDRAKYADCLLMQNYLRFLDRHAVSYDKDVKTLFQNDTYKLSLVLNNEDERLEMGWQEYQKYKTDLLKSHFATFTLNEYKTFLAQCQEITETDEEDRAWFSIRGSVTQVLADLGETNADLFCKVITHIFQSGNPLGLSDWKIVNQIIENSKSQREAYKFINNHDYLYKDKFLFEFFALVGRKKAQSFYLAKIYELYRKVELKHLPADFDYLLPYRAIDKDVVVNVIDTIHQRTNQEGVQISWSSLFDSHSETSQQLGEIFQHKIELIKTIYLSNRVHGDSDYQSYALQKILDLDENFIFEYIDWMYSHHQYLSHHHDHRNYNFLWMRPNYKDELTKIIDYIFQKENRWFSHTYLSVFFIRHQGEIEEDVEERKFEVLSHYIEQSSDNSDRMRYIFGLVADSYSHKQHELFSLFLKHNQNFEDFLMLPIDPSSGGFTGSMIPVFEARIRVLEFLLPVVSGNVAFLQHRSSLEAQIESWKKTIESESKREFMGR